MPSEGEPIIPTWVIWVGVGLTVAVAGLVVLWYLKHPGETPFAVIRFEKRLDVPSTNGHVPGPATGVGSAPAGGEAEGEEAA